MDKVSSDAQFYVNQTAKLIQIMELQFYTMKLYISTVATELDQT